MRIQRVAVLSLVLLLASPLVAAAQSGHDLFQQALRKERTEGDLAGAIELYRRIAQGADRTLAARALVRMGAAYERMGRDEAQDAYRRVLRDYADQPDPVSTARGRLAALAAGAGPAPANGLAVRLVWEDDRMDIEGRPTPDGRYLTWVDWWDTGDLALRELATGRSRAITEGGDGGTVYPLQSSVSRDGRRVAYFWTPPNPRGWQPQLRTIGLDGTDMRVLVENANFEIDYIDPYDWTPDGRYVLAAFWLVSHTAQLVMVSTTDGVVRVLKTLDWRRPVRAALSPDGRWVAYDLPPDTLTGRRDLFILTADGSSEFHIEHPADDVRPIWSPTGDHLLFSSDRGGSVGLWAVPMANGRPRGEAILVQGEMAQGFSPMDFAGDVLFYAQDTGGGDIHTASFDPVTLRVGEPQRLINAFQGYNSAAYWSADGSTLAYASRRGAPAGGQSARLIVRDMRTDRESVFERGPTLHRSFSRPMPSADGSRVAVWSDDRRGQTGLNIVDVATGSYRNLARFDDLTEELGNPQWSRDGRALVYGARLHEGRRFALIRQDIDTGAKQELLSDIPPLGGRIRLHTALSPDERSFAYAGFRGDTFRISVIPLDGGAARELVSRRVANLGAPYWAGLTWTPDGKHILFGVPVDVEERLLELMVVPAAGGEARSTGLVARELRHVSFAPDGRITFSSGRLQRRQVWTMENVLARLGRND